MTRAVAVASRAGVALAVALAALVATAALAEPRFVLSDGTAVPGEIIQATRNTLTVRRTIGGIQQIPKSELTRVEVRTADGATVSGAFAGWQDGRMALRAGAELVWIDRDRVVGREGGVAAAEPPAPAAGPSEAMAAAALARPAALTRAQSEADDDAGAAATPGAPVLKVVAEPAVDPSAREVVFTLELTDALEAPLGVVFSTVDGAAQEGVHYEPQDGLLTIPAGSTRGEVRVPLLEGGAAAGERQFHLLVAANPERVRVVDEWTTVTIRGKPGS